MPAIIVKCYLIGTNAAILILSVLSAVLTTVAADNSNSKRGLAHIYNEDYVADDIAWTDTESPGGLAGLPEAGENMLRWYYNYQSMTNLKSPLETATVSNRGTDTHVALEFVPMLWGDDENVRFVEDVRMLKGNGTIVEYVLAFNEPDMKKMVGGSNISPDRAADIWREKVEPLKADGLKLGAPAVAGTEKGKEWLAKFFQECTGCSIDFIPLHWYGDFPGFASYLGHIHNLYPNHPLWVTEFTLPNKGLVETQAFFKTSIEHLDKLDYVQRYAWFGAFRSSESNVGKNVAFMDHRGRLTDIGSWYLGGEGTGIEPTGGAGRELDNLMSQLKWIVPLQLAVMGLVIA